MDTKDFQRIRASLLEQRRNLTDWLSNTPASKKQVCLGVADERAVHTHLHALDTAIAKTEDETLGYCDVCNEFVDVSRLEMDYTISVCLDHLSGEERDRLQDDLELSVKVQKALLPQQVPEIPGLELAAFSRPAEYVGGDYFDFFRFQDQSHGLVIGDVMGHGIAASLLMASLQASLRTLAPDYGSPAEIVRRLNSIFHHNIHLTKFVTLFLARYDSETRSLTYSNAGHNPPLLYRSQSNGTGPLSWLAPTGAAIGLVEDTEFGEDTVTLAPGDTLLLYTDGVTEAKNPRKEEFGQERLVELVRQGSNRSAQALVREVRNGLEAFIDGQPLADDTTIVAGRAEG